MLRTHLRYKSKRLDRRLAVGMNERKYWWKESHRVEAKYSWIPTRNDITGAKIGCCNPWQRVPYLPTRWRLRRIVTPVAASGAAGVSSCCCWISDVIQWNTKDDVHRERTYTGRKQTIGEERGGENSVADCEVRGGETKGISQAGS